MTMSRNQNFAIIGALATFLMGGGGSLVVWAADQRYELKDTTAELMKSVNENSQAQAATMASVDSLLVKILDTEIDRLETELEALEALPDPTPAERDRIRQARRDLNDASQERQATLTRILDRRAQ